jgi:hypothetical protein
VFPWKSATAVRATMGAAATIAAAAASQAQPTFGQQAEATEQLRETPAVHESTFKMLPFSLSDSLLGLEPECRVAHIRPRC